MSIGLIKNNSLIALLVLIAVQFFFPITSISSEIFENKKNHSITLKNPNILARIISGRHYKKPNYNIVIKYSSNLNKLNSYLRRLDPYSEFVSSEHLEYNKIRSQENRVGVGLDFLVNERKILAIPIMGGPAFKAGITAPVYVYKINGQILDIENFSSYRYIAYMKEGDYLTLDYKHHFDEDSVERIQLFAEQVERQAVTVSTDGSNLVLQVRDIRRGEIYSIKKALTLASRQQRLIIDLRYSPGGDIYALVDWLSLLLNDEIPVITLRKQSNRNKGVTLLTLPGKIELKVPIVIVISEYTASSAEIFARILRTQRPNTIILGWPSKGKCLAQSSYALGGHGALKLSTYNVDLIDSGICEGVPIQPDILEAGIETYDSKQIHHLVERVVPVTLP